jgi:transposase
VAVTNGELYTIITNKVACGKQGALVAMTEGTKVSDIVPILQKIPLYKGNTVTEVTLDMTNNMEAIVRNTFPKAKLVADRFHVQQRVTEAVQEIRIDLRREAIKQENEAIKKAKAEKKKYHAPTHENGDTKKQLLARSRYLLFKPESK